MTKDARMSKLVVLALTGMLLVGCNRAFSNDLAFQAPPGWVYSAVPSGGEVWVKGSGTNEQIMAQQVSTPLPKWQPGWKKISICGGHDAVLMVDKSNKGQIWEGVSTNWGAQRYMAVYVRPVGVAPDPQAETAIRTLCQKRQS